MSPALGLRAFAHGLKHSRRKELRRYIWLPVIVSLIVISSGSYFAFGYLSDLAEFLIARLPDWLAFLELLLKPLLYLIGVLIGAWSFAFLAVLISSPFLGALSLAVERACFGNVPERETGLWMDLGSSFAREGRKLLYYLPRLVAVFLLTLIPVVNLASPFIWLIFGAWTMAVQFIDYPGENRQQPFQDTLAKLHAN
ncbi:MAG: sulfate transporter CysZ, partial [Pseudomonadales bacterium]